MKKFTIILFLLAVHTASAFSQTGRQKDSLALVTLYDSLGGANWTTKTNWRTNTAISTWYGVTLDTILQRVTSLVLGNNNLQGILPQRIGNIDSLTQLDLAQNKINGIIPDTLYHLIRLSTVYLNFQNTNGFGISGTISPKIGQLQRLQILYLYTNKISGTIPPEIGNCKKLMSLDLGNNLLTGSIPVELGDLFFLQSLGLSSNVLSGTIPDLSGCASLSTINLSTNRLTGKIHPSIWTRTNLFSLTLNDNRLSPDSIPSAIGNLTNLDYLQLINDSLIGEIPAALSNCTKLRGIFLTGNSLSGRVPDLSAFNLLQFLWIDRNRFDSLQNLTPLPVLSDLEINNNRFDFNDIEPNVGAATTFTYSGQDSLGAGTTITLPVGAPMTLSVSPGGTANSYQWTKNNIDIGGATSATYTIASTSTANQGSYGCRMTNANVPGLTLYLKQKKFVSDFPAAAPQNVTAIPAGLNAYVKWNKSLEGDVKKYKIFRDVVTNPTTLVDSTTSISDTLKYFSGLTHNTLYYFRVTAVDTFNQESAFSSTVSALAFDRRITDSLALISFYDSLGGAAWTTKTNWKSGAINTWFGITMDAALNRVAKIQLSNNNVIGRLPIQIGNLDSLKELNLGPCRITGSIPDTLFNLKRLLELNLVNTTSPGLTGPLSPRIGELTRLTAIDIYNNSLSGSLPPSIGNCKSLVSLRLAQNLFTGAIPDQIWTLTNLKYLWLGPNRFSPGPLSPSITNVQLWVLDAQGDSLTSIPDLSSMGGLYRLELNNNMLTGKIPSWIWNKTSLSHILNLSNNPFSQDTLPNAISGLFNLQNIFLKNDSLIGQLPSTAGDFSDAVSLDFSSNNLSGRVPNLDGLTSISSLTINDTKLDSMPSLISLSGHLNFINMSNSRFDFGDIQRAKASNAATVLYSGQDSIPAPSEKSIPSGNSFTVSVVTGGTGNSYQWQLNNTDISGATSASYSTTASASTIGGYRCKITNTNVANLTLYTKTTRIILELSPAIPQLASATPGNQSIVMTMRSSEKDLLRFRIFADTISGSSILRDSTLLRTDTVKTLAGLLAGRTYFVRVAAVDTTGLVSGFSNEIIVTPDGVPGIVIASATTLSDTRIRLNWSTPYVSGIASKYRLFRSAAGGAFSQIDSVTAPGFIYTDSILTSNTLYNYQIYAINSYGVSNAATTGIPTLPVITAGVVQVAPTSPTEDQATTISATITGQALTAKLFFGKPNQTQIDSLTMVATGTTYSAQIPTSSVSLLGVWFQIRLQNNGGTVWYPASGRVEIPVQIKSSSITALTTNGVFPLGLASGGFNTVCIPYTVNFDLKQILGDKILSGLEPTNWRMFSVNPFTGALEDVENITTGNAFFLNVIGNSNSTILSQIPVGSTNSKAVFDNYVLKPSWNLVPWPFAYSANLSVLDNTKIGKLWQMVDNEWVEVTQVKPYGGLAIKNKTAGDVTVGSVISAALSKPQSIPPFYMQINAKTKHRKDRYNFVGMSESAKDGYDDTDESEPLNMGDYVSLSFKNDQESLSTDMRTLGADGHIWEMNITNRTSDEKATLDWEMQTIPSDFQIMMIDLSNNHWIDMTKVTTYFFTSHEENPFKIIAGGGEYVRKQMDAISQTLPDRFDLAQNYPNPFNPTTQIKFDIAKPTHVKLIIYNMLGQEVATLANGFYTTGRYNLPWNGHDLSGRQVASGVYIYRIETDTFTKSRKMLLIK